MKHLFKQKNQGHTELERSLSKLHARFYDGKYRWKVRASSLPFCPRFYAFHLLFHKLGGVEPPFTEKFILDVTGGTGTATHETYQTWLSRAGVLFGDYYCKRCGIHHYDRIGPIMCMACGKETLYEEISIEDSLIGLSGHIDGLCPVDPEDLRKGFLLVDIKTGKEQDVEPTGGSIHKGTGFALSFYQRVWKKWMCQISIYAHGVEQKTIEVIENDELVSIRVKIVGCAIIVVNRGRPWRNRLVFTNDVDWDFYEHTVHSVTDTEDSVRRFVATRKPKFILELESHCRNIHDGRECPWAQLCFNKRLSKELETVLDDKLSKSQVRNRLLKTCHEDPNHPRSVADPIYHLLR